MDIATLPYIRIGEKMTTDTVLKLPDGGQRGGYFIVEKIYTFAFALAAAIELLIPFS